jgi:hypothetical protein
MVLAAARAHAPEHVAVSVALLHEGFVAVDALEGLVEGMDPHVVHGIAQLREGTAALNARQPLVLPPCPLVDYHCLPKASVDVILFFFLTFCLAFRPRSRHLNFAALTFLLLCGHNMRGETCLPLAPSGDAFRACQLLMIVLC